MPEADRKNFFDIVRNGLLGPTLSADEVAGCNAILDAFEGTRVMDKAYALATAYLETNHTMLPVVEAYWLSPNARYAYCTRMYDIKGARPAKARELGNLQPGDGALYCGRGYCQVTGRKNYQDLDNRLGYHGALVKNPDMMLQPEVAAKVMALGMKLGSFTGRKLSDFQPGQYVEMRTIINGHDRAQDIADFAKSFEVAVQAIH